jgi:lysophospholipase L1-like esterase
LKNILLAAATALVTLLVALLALRRLAPTLVGEPVEVRIVQSSEQVPPFYEHVFASTGIGERLPDPVTGVRERGLRVEGGGRGPHDLLGFRNHAVPNVTSVVAIGDSQTYGAGARYLETWPRQLQGLLGLPDLSVYSMACGGWGPAAYLAMARVAGGLRPRAVVVAYYTGNDPHDAFSQAYMSPLWSELRVNPRLGPADMPKATGPAPWRQTWKARFGDGYAPAFTPEYRLVANNRSKPGVLEGYAIIAKSAALIARALEGEHTRVFFTVIPTKELVYAQRVRAEGLKPPAAYEQLVRDEAVNIAELARALAAVRRTRYVDVLTPLQQAARRGARLYRSDSDGHPAALGYTTIGKAIADAIRQAVAGAADERADGEASLPRDP